MNTVSTINESLPETERPAFSENEIIPLLKDQYDLCCTVKELPGERDRNYLAQDKIGNLYVLKISNASESLDYLETQNQALECTAKLFDHGRIPSVIPDKNGESLSRTCSTSNSSHWTRLVKFVDGIPMAQYRPHTKEFLHELGLMCGTVTKALQEIPMQPSVRRHLWEMHNAKETLQQYIQWIDDRKMRSLVSHFLDLYNDLLTPVEQGLRRGWIHNDCNDYNVLVIPNLHGTPSLGLIDFGDMTHSYLAAEPAAACAYAMLNKAEPLEAAVHLISGFHKKFLLEEKEVEILYPMILIRLCLSVTLGAFQQQKEPDNEYLGISQEHVRKLLENLQDNNVRYVHHLFRGACNYEPSKKADEFRKWQKKPKINFHSLLKDSLTRKNTIVLDLSTGSPLSAKLQCMSVDDQQNYLDLLLQEKKAQTAVGKYSEVRSIYSAEQFFHNSLEGDEKRTIHLGIDIFAKAGTCIYAPFDGVVQHLNDNRGHLDYGPTVILKHQPSDGPLFYTLYGHLGSSCLKNLNIGQLIKGGMPLAETGNSKENGGWIPHVHFQIILDLLDSKGNYPGVALPSKQNVWTSICPDPGIMLGLGKKSTAKEIKYEELYKRRSNVFGPSLSLNYKNPLIIVQGQAQSLIDHKGQFYLDCVNNVAHVGHSHPSVSKALSDQSYVLNTNTRFLNNINIEYAERLCDLFPEPLNTCFLVCSGSEANELALRLAFTFSEEKDVIVLEEAYHGNTSTNIDISPYKHNGPGGKGPPDWVHEIPMPYVYRGMYRDPETAGKLYSDKVHEICEKLSALGRKPAAFICESILGCGGHVPLPDDFLQKSYQHVRKYGGLCIADEIQVGFGRTGKHMWAFEMQGVLPDIITLGKPIGNGHPLGAVITTREIAKTFANGMEYFNTFGGSQVSSAVGMAVLDVMEKEGLMQNSLENGRLLKKNLEELKKTFPLIGDVRGEGYFLGIELVIDPETKEPAPLHAEYIVERMKSLRILLSTEGPGHNVIKLKPPMVFNQKNIQKLTVELENILSETPLQTNH